MGARLRYEFDRKFAPYIGVSWTRQFGDTADFTRAENGNPITLSFVTGVKLWF
jgi:copper resistance protein B